MLRKIRFLMTVNIPLIRNTSKRFSALSEGDDWAISGIGNRDEVAVDCGIRTEP
jgi:hypothetical protein